MSRRAALKAIFSGEPITFEALAVCLNSRFAVSFRWVQGKVWVAPEWHGLPCYEPLPRPRPAIVDRHDGIEIALGDDPPKHGNIALAVFYDGNAWESALVLFREQGGKLEGWNPSYDEWIPLKRFRVVGILVRRTSPDGLKEEIQTDGIVYPIREAATAP